MGVNCGPPPITQLHGALLDWLHFREEVHTKRKDVDLAAINYDLAKQSLANALDRVRANVDPQGRVARELFFWVTPRGHTAPVIVQVYLDSDNEKQVLVVDVEDP